MATILYCRVSSNSQTIAHQKLQAEAAGFKFDEVICDEGVSGVSTRLEERAQGKRLFDLLRRSDVLVVRWIDRLGRNYQDVSDTIREFMRRGIVIRTIINNMTFDGSTTDPMQQAVRDSLIAFMAASAQAQAEATKEAQKAGIAYAKERMGKIKYLGRKPTYTTEKIDLVLSMKTAGNTVSGIAKELGLTRQTVYRILENPDEAISNASQWEQTRQLMKQGQQQSLVNAA